MATCRTSGTKPTPGGAEAAAEVAAAHEGAHGLGPRRRQRSEPGQVDDAVLMTGLRAGQHLAPLIDHRHLAQHRLADQALRQHPAQLRIGLQLALAHQFGQRSQGQRGGVDAARGVVFQHARHQLGDHESVLQAFLALVAHGAQRHQQHQRGQHDAGQADIARAQRTRAAQPTLARDQQPGQGAPRGHGQRTMISSRPWRRAAASRRPSFWMRCTNPSSRASQASSPGFTA